MNELNERIQYANISYDESQKQKKDFEQRVEEIKSNLKITMDSDINAAGDFADVDFGFDLANKKGCHASLFPVQRLWLIDMLFPPDAPRTWAKVQLGTWIGSRGGKWNMVLAKV